jgi:uncharacterized protein
MMQNDESEVKILKMRNEMINLARKHISEIDPSHDLGHSIRVLKNAEYISKYEGGDLEVIIPAALFHDVINYAKDDVRSKFAANESAKVTRDILERFFDCDDSKISRVETAIIEHSFSSGIIPESLDSKIIQDSDRLEATGALSVMRTFSSTGQMKRQFYDFEDPFCLTRKPDSHKYAIDLFYKRLLKVKDLMNTETARQLAEKRTVFLYAFLDQLKDEILLK